MSQGLDYSQLFPNRFLESEMLQGRDWTLAIRSVDLEKLPRESKEKDANGDQIVVEETRGTIAFAGTERRLVLNKTNGLCLKAMFGRKIDAWTGKRIVLYSTTEKCFGESMLVMRIRGSPDLPADVEFKLKLPHHKPRKMTMKKTPEPAAKESPSGAGPDTRE